MKVSALIERLQEAQVAHGDLPVEMSRSTVVGEGSAVVAVTSWLSPEPDSEYGERVIGLTNFAVASRCMLLDVTRNRK